MYKNPDPTFHLRDEHINEYLDGELSPEDVTILETHLDVCEHCAARLDNVRYVFTSLAALPDLPMEIDLAPQIIRLLRPSSESPWQWPVFRWIFSAQALATIALLFAAWPFVANWIGGFWRAYLVVGAPEWLTIFVVNSIGVLAEGWSSLWQRVWLSLQGYWSQAAALWDQLFQPSIGLQLPVFGVVILLVAALILWLAGNGLLLRPGRIQGYPSISNGGNHD